MFKEPGSQMCEFILSTSSTPTALDGLNLTLFYSGFRDLRKRQEVMLSVEKEVEPHILIYDEHMIYMWYRTLKLT